MLLDATTKSIRAFLSAAPSSNQPIYSVDFTENTDTTIVGKNSDGLLNGSTPVTLVAAPTSGIQRQVKTLTIYNADTSPITVTVEMLNGANQRTIIKRQVLTGQELQYEYSTGWTVAQVSNSGVVSVTSNELSAGVALEASNRVSADNALSNVISALASAHNALSNRVSTNSAAGGGGGSVTSTELSAASAQAASAIATETSNRVSADNALSNAVSAASAAVTSVNSKFDNVSARSIVGSVKGTQSAINAVSDRLSIEASARQRDVSLINSIFAGLSAKSVGGTSVHGLQSILNALSNKISVGGGGGGSVTSTELSAASAQAASAIAAEVSNRVSADNVLSVAIAAVSNALSNEGSIRGALSALVQGASVRSVGDVSTKGLQSVLNALSNKISAVVAGGGVSVTSTELSAASAQAASAIAAEISNRVSADNALSNAVSAASAQAQSAISVVALSLAAETSSRIEQVSVISHKVSVLSAIVHGVSVQSAGTSVKGLQSVLNTLSNLISAGGGGGGSVTSTELSAVSAQAASALSAALNVSARQAVGGASVKGLQSILNAISERVSIARGRGNVLTASAVTISAATLTVVPGTTVCVSGGIVYKLDGVLAVNRGAAAQVMGYGLRLPPLLTGRGTIATNQSATGGALPTASVVFQEVPWNGDSANGAILLSTISMAKLSCVVRMQGMIFVSTGGHVAWMVKASTGAGAGVVQRGSYLNAYRISD